MDCKHLNCAVVRAIGGAVVVCAVCGSVLAPVANHGSLPASKSAGLVVLAMHHDDDNRDGAPRADPVPKPAMMVTIAPSLGHLFTIDPTKPA